MIVAMISMGMVKVSIDQIIDMIAMGHGFMPTIGAVDMGFGMPANVMVACAFIGMCGVHFNHVFFYLAAFLMHQTAVVEEIRVPMMFNWCMPATGAMLMIFWSIHNRRYWILGFLQAVQFHDTLTKDSTAGD